MHYLGCENVNEVMIGIVSMFDPSDFLVGYCKDAMSITDPDRHRIQTDPNG